MVGGDFASLHSGAHRDSNLPIPIPRADELTFDLRVVNQAERVRRRWSRAADAALGCCAS